MRIITNQGSNLDEEVSHRFEVDLTPQRIVVDGIPHDTRNKIEFAQIDSWVQRATRHPHVQGTTTDDCLDVFGRMGMLDPQLIAVMTSRKLIGSHDAAVEAVSRLKASAEPAQRGLRVEVVDSCVTDLGTGLVTLAAAQARKAGLGIEAVADFARKFAARQTSVITPARLDNLIKGGRASFLTGWVANFFEIRPLIAIIDGELKSAGRMKAKADLGARVLEYFSERVEPKGTFWIGVAHGDDPARGQAVRDALTQRYQPVFTMFRPLSPSIYLHLGRGAVAAFVYRLDGLPFIPPPPEMASP